MSAPTIWEWLSDGGEKNQAGKKEIYALMLVIIQFRMREFLIDRTQLMEIIGI